MLTYDIPNLHQPKHPASQRTYISQNTLPHQQCRCLQNTGCAIKWRSSVGMTVAPTIGITVAVARTEYTIFDACNCNAQLVVPTIASCIQSLNLTALLYQ